MGYNRVFYEKSFVSLIKNAFNVVVFFSISRSMYTKMSTLRLKNSKITKRSTQPDFNSQLNPVVNFFIALLLFYKNELWLSTKHRQTVKETTFTRKGEKVEESEKNRFHFCGNDRERQRVYFIVRKKRMILCFYSCISVT